MSDEKTQAIDIVPMQYAVATLSPADASPEGLALMRSRVATQTEMLKVAISLTSPGQWVVFSGGEGKESIYPTGGAADTILRRAFGLTWGEKRVTIENTPTGPEAVCVATLMHGTAIVETFEGRRRMGGFLKNEGDLRKGSVENMKSNAVRDLLGLRFRSPDELKVLGLDIGKLQRRADFADHKSDGDVGGVCVPFGKLQGTPLSQVDDRNLEWYVEAAKKSIADPAKAKFKAKEEKWLANVLAEQKRRLDPPKEKPAEKTSAGTDYGPPPMTDEEIAAVGR